MAKLGSFTRYNASKSEVKVKFNCAIVFHIYDFQLMFNSNTGPN